MKEKYINKPSRVIRMSAVTPDLKTIRYGELVEYVRPDGYHTGVKVHFFNAKGVFIGNYYTWVSYKELRYPSFGRRRELVYLGARFEKPKQALYELCCNIVTGLIRITQKMSSR